MRTYKVEVGETSRPVTAKERIALKDTTSAVRLDEATTKDGRVLIHVDMWAVLNIHNEASEDKEYQQYVIVDSDGSRYVTGSSNFWDSFLDIYEEMENEDEDWSIVVYRVPSKNYKGKEFLTCAIV